MSNQLYALAMPSNEIFLFVLEKFRKSQQLFEPILLYHFNISFAAKELLERSFFLLEREKLTEVGTNLL